MYIGKKDDPVFIFIFVCDVTLLTVFYTNRELFGKMLTLIDFAELLILKKYIIIIIIVVVVVVSKKILKKMSQWC